MTAGASAANWCGERSAGSASTTSWENTCCDTTLRTSTVGATPDTLIDSSRAPTDRSALTVAMNDVGSCTPSRRTVLNPASVNVTV